MPSQSDPDGYRALTPAQRRAERIEQLARVRDAARMAAPVVGAAPDPRLVAAVGEQRAAELLDGSARQRRATEHRSEVDRLSRAGRPVREIAAALGVSERHVVALRAQLGVGRKR